MVLHGLGIIIWLTSLPRNINFRLAAGRWWLSRNVRVTLSERWWWWWPRSITVRLSDAISSRRAPPYPPIYPHCNILSCIATFIDRLFCNLHVVLLLAHQNFPGSFSITLLFVKEISVKYNRCARMMKLYPGTLTSVQCFICTFWGVLISFLAVGSTLLIYSIFPFAGQKGSAHR